MRWGTPGGGLDPGESHDDGLRRELHEELGSDRRPSRPAHLEPRPRVPDDHRPGRPTRPLLPGPGPALRPGADDRLGADARRVRARHPLVVARRDRPVRRGLRPRRHWRSMLRAAPRRGRPPDRTGGCQRSARRDGRYWWCERDTGSDRSDRRRVRRAGPRTSAVPCWARPTVIRWRRASTTSTATPAVAAMAAAAVGLVDPAAPGRDRRPRRQQPRPQCRRPGLGPRRGPRRHPDRLRRRPPATQRRRHAAQRTVAHIVEILTDSDD